MKMQKKLSIFVFLGVAVLAQQSWAAPHLSLFGVGTFSKPDQAGFTFTSKLGVGGGLSLEFPIAPRWGFEVGGLYITRKYDTDGSTYAQPTIQIPVMLRLWFNRFISIAAGAYGAFGMGNITVTTGGVSSSQSFSDTGEKKADYGVLGGLRLNFPLSASTSFFVDGRYTKSLTDASTDGSNLKYGDIQALAGFTFGMSGK